MIKNKSHDFLTAGVSNSIARSIGLRNGVGHLPNVPTWSGWPVTCLNFPLQQGSLINSTHKFQVIFFLSDAELARSICSSLISEVQSPQITIKFGQKAVISDVRHCLFGQSHTWEPLIGARCEGWLQIDPSSF